MPECYNNIVEPMTKFIKEIMILFKYPTEHQMLIGGLKNQKYEDPDRENSNEILNSLVIKFK